MKTMDNLKVETTYSGKVFPEDASIDSDWIIELMENMKNNTFIHTKYLFNMITKVKEHYQNLPSLVDVDIPEYLKLITQRDKEFTVCGDVHGQYYDLLNIFKINGYPSKENPYLFNGDFVDRGSFSVEIIITLIAWKILLPEHFHLARGNHETKNLNKLYG